MRWTLRPILCPQHFDLASLAVSCFVSQVWWGGNVEAEVLTEREVCRAQKHFRIEINVHGTTCRVLLVVRLKTTVNTAGFCKFGHRIW